MKGNSMQKSIEKFEKTGNLSSDIEQVLFSEDDIKTIVKRLGGEIYKTYSKAVLERHEKLVLLGVLNGSVQFLGSLVNYIDLPLEMEFMFASSYGNSTVPSDDVVINMGKRPEILNDENCNILIVEDKSCCINRLINEYTNFIAVIYTSSTTYTQNICNMF